LGAIIGSSVLYLLTSQSGLEGTGANDLQTLNGDTVKVLGGLLAEIFFTAVFVFVVLGATSSTNGATNNFAGLAIGLALVLVHLACIRYTGTSVNPARSIGPALFQGGTALSNLWIFIVGPFIGAALAAGMWKLVEPKK
jgi:aquaporin Z